MHCFGSLAVSWCFFIVFIVVASGVQSSSSSTEHCDSFGNCVHKTRTIRQVNERKCGTVNSEATRLPLIARGTRASITSAPWHAAIYNHTGLGDTYICGGSLITKSHVLTAAHCVLANIYVNQVIDPGLINVRLGMENRRRPSRSLQLFHVLDIKKHEGFNLTKYHNDIAVMVLDREVDVSESVRPICIWSGNWELTSVVNMTGYVFGWGLNEENAFPEDLQYVGMPIVESFTCSRTNPGFYYTFLSDKAFCAGYRNGSSVCTGDSGGGLALFVDGVWYLRGIVSLSQVLVANKCNPNQYIIFTDARKYLEWVEAYVRKTPPNSLARETTNLLKEKISELEAENIILRSKQKDFLVRVKYPWDILCLKNKVCTGSLKSLKDTKFNDFVKTGQVGKVYEMLADCYDPSDGLWPPLQDAAEHGRTEITKMLIKFGADLNRRGYEQLAALHIACGHGKNETHVEIVKLLLLCGAEVNVVDLKGNAPLHHVAHHGSTESSLRIVQILLENHADVHVKSAYGDSPLDIVLRENKSPMAERIAAELRKYGAKTKDE